MKRIIYLLVVMLLLCSAFAEGELKQTFSEDDNKLLIQEEYMDDAGQLYVGDKGFARHTLEDDEAGHVIREAYYDGQGKADRTIFLICAENILPESIIQRILSILYQ